MNTDQVVIYIVVGVLVLLFLGPSIFYILCHRFHVDPKNKIYKTIATILLMDND